MTAAGPEGMAWRCVERIGLGIGKVLERGLQDIDRGTMLVFKECLDSA